MPAINPVLANDHVTIVAWMARVFQSLLNGQSGTLDLTNTSDDISTYLAPGTIIEFSITNASNSEGLIVNVNNFDAVPAPLPAAGAATAFGYSRRLRRRIKGKHPQNSKPQVPAHPAAYLKLSQEIASTLPLAFDYSWRVDQTGKSDRISISVTSNISIH